MLKHLSLSHSRVFAIVGFNPRKKYAVPPQQRVEMLQAMIDGAGLRNIEAVLVDGLVWKWCSRMGIKTMYRGIRTWSSDGAAETHLHFQNTFFPPFLGPSLPIPTVFLLGDPAYNHISSTLVRDICGGEGEEKEKRGRLEELVGGEIVERVAESYGGREGE